MKWVDPDIRPPDDALRAADAPVRVASQPFVAEDEALRILAVEDNDDDYELVRRMLRDLLRPQEWRRVATEPELRVQLAAFRPHLVLCDHTMPGFSGARALEVVRRTAPEIPFIFVSGTIGEEAAIEALQQGAVDYVLKDNLRRLPTAAANALAIAGKRIELRETEQALRESDERFRAIVQSTGDWVWEIDSQQRVVYTNASIQRILGLAPEQVLGQRMIDFVLPEDRQVFSQRQSEALDARVGWHNRVTRVRHVDGSVRWLESTAAPRVDAQGAIVGHRGIDRDITQRIEHEAKIRQLARFHAMLSELGDAVLRAQDLPSLLEHTCRLAVRQGDFKLALIGMPNSDGQVEIVTSAGDPHAAAMLRALGPADPNRPDHRFRPSLRVLRSGKREVARDYSQASITPEVREQMQKLGIGAQVVLPVGRPPWAVLGLCTHGPQEFDEEETALLERVAAQIDYARSAIAKGERLEYLAHHDAVTGLPNRAALMDYAQPFGAGRNMYLVAVRLARFHALRDARGHAIAERVLTAIGRRLWALQADGDLVAHVGGEYFLLAGVASGEQAALHERIEQLLLEASALPAEVDGEQIDVVLRGGLVEMPTHGPDLETLERNALSALVEAERREVPLLGFNDELRARAERNLLLDRELRVALSESQFELFLQPKFAGTSGMLSGAEALLRWRHPVHGLIPPFEFIPVLESTGLISATGAWVMQQALDTVSAWPRRDGTALRIAVNVSARELREAGFVERCQRIIGERGALLEIEVTESELMDDIERSIGMLDALRRLGCTVAIDDFGTGYSSLNYLSRLPADVLKIDRSFMPQLSTSKDTLALVTNIIGLAHQLGLSVVAEGVETPEQEAILRTLGCDELQGYLFGRPMPIAAFEAAYGC